MKRNRGVCVSSGIEDNVGPFGRGFLDPVDKIAFMVRLAEFYANT